MDHRIMHVAISKFLVTFARNARQARDVHDCAIALRYQMPQRACVSWFFSKIKYENFGSKPPRFNICAGNALIAAEV